MRTIRSTSVGPSRNSEAKNGPRTVPQRSVFLIDPDHVVRWRWVADDDCDAWNGGPIRELSA